MAQFNTTQVRVRKNCIIAEGSGGHVFYTNAARARALINAGAVDLVNPIVIGPKETKPAEPAEKKSYHAAPDGPSTDSAPSSEPGAASSSASQAGLVSNLMPPTVFRKRGRPKKSG